MRPPAPSRALLVAAVVVAMLATVGGAASAAPGQSADPPPAIEVLPTPSQPGPTSSQAHVPSGAAPFSATTSPESAAVPAAPEGVPQSIIGAQESVIGADGRERLDLAATSTFPLSAIGQIEFKFEPNGITYICTGYLIDGNSVLTAGHCSFDGGAGPAGQIDTATFFPGWERNNGAIVNPFGGCPVSDVWAPDQWVDDGKPAHDYAVQQLAGTCDFSETAGSFGLFTLSGDNAFAGRRLRVEGYPGDQSSGSRWKMVDEVYRNNINTLFYPMDTYGGQSGSPLFKWNRPSCGGPCSAGVHAYGAGGNPPMNSGPMLTAGRISTILAVAAENV